MTANETEYISETSELIKFFDGKQSRIKSYIATCHRYIQELREGDPIKLYSKIESDQMFIQLLSFVEETYRPDHFISCCSFDYIEIFDPDFVQYMLSIQKQIKRPIKWKMLCDLEYKFSTLKMQFNIKSGFSVDFTSFASKHIKLKDLWNHLTE